MAFFSQDGAMHGSWLSGTYKPPSPITRLLCNTCALPEIPFEPVRLGDRITHHRQVRPWKWAPYFGRACDVCGTQC